MTCFLKNWDHNIRHGALYLGCTDMRCQVMWANKFFTMAPSICRSLAWNLPHVILLAPRILMRLQTFWEICVSLPYIRMLQNHVTLQVQFLR